MITVVRQQSRLGDHLLAGFFTKLLIDNGIQAQYGITKDSFHNILDLPCGTGGEEFIFDYSHHENNKPAFFCDPRDSNLMDLPIRRFKEAFGYSNEFKIVTPYVPIKFSLDEGVPPVDVVLVTQCGSFAPVRDWPHFSELKTLLKKEGISFVDINELAYDWTNNPDLVNKVNNWIFKCRVFIGLETGASHYATGILHKKPRLTGNFIIQSGFIALNFWAGQYGGIYTQLQGDVNCAPCYCGDPLYKFFSFNLQTGKVDRNIIAKCDNNHRCMRGVEANTVLNLIKAFK